MPAPASAHNTVTLVRAHQSAMRSLDRTPGGHFRKGHRVRARRIPRQEPPHAIEASFAQSIITGVLHELRAAIRPLLDHLPGLLESAARQDSDDAELERPTLDARALRYVAGLPIVIENPRGSTRTWTEPDGTVGSTVMRHDYGYIAGTVGADGEDVDVYLGRVADPADIHVVHQMARASGFEDYDEDKVMIGFVSAAAAREAYLEQYDDPRFFGGMTTMSVAEFRSRLAEPGAIRADGWRLDSWRADAGETATARRLLDRARAQLNKKSLDTSAIDNLSRRFGMAASAFQRAQLARQVRAALGVDLVGADKNVAPLIESFVHESVARIRSLGDRSLDDVERIVAHAFTVGRLAEDVMVDLAKRYDISERHARFIARDQIGTLTGLVNAARQKSIGVTSFTWRTVEDERVREEHEILDGERFPYDDPPSEGLPGTPNNCRCSAEPVFDQILEAAAGTDDEE